MSTQNPKPVPVVNIANAFTVLRLILVPVFIWVFLQATPEHRWWAWAIFAVAAATDKIDGHLARSRGLITNFGKLADSIADKALILSAFILLSYHGMLWWWVTILFIVRELGITLMRAFMANRKVMAAGQGGKIKMFAQSLGAAGLIIPWETIFPEWAATGMYWISYGLIGIALFFAITSAVEYIAEARKIVKADQ